MTNMNIEGIKTHEQLQPRVEMDQTLIDEYADAITNGAKFPAVTVFQDNTVKIRKWALKYAPYYE